MGNQLKITVIFEDRENTIIKEMRVDAVDYYNFHLHHARIRPFQEAYDEYIEKQRSRVMKGGD